MTETLTHPKNKELDQKAQEEYERSNIKQLKKKNTNKY